jgi:hypothetical protein
MHVTDVFLKKRTLLDCYMDFFFSSMLGTRLRALGWAAHAVLFFPFKIMGNRLPQSVFLLSDLFSGQT